MNLNRSSDIYFLRQNASMPDNGNSGGKDYTSLIKGNGSMNKEQKHRVILLSIHFLLFRFL